EFTRVLFVSIFKVIRGKGEATRVTVGLGRASVNTIEIKNGLNIGDSVIVSDMTPFDNNNRVRIKYPTQPHPLTSSILWPLSPHPRPRPPSPLRRGQATSL